ncbi:hypothetical protein EJ06DRAFT_525989 [Trichodelitschia bisporula]|uniref:Uncharacterized protein n=1 Tax=Trichodelitschia bisporula TaxID=703511 RepID=A0A6G1IBC0_9PEZI|nr:hypothetical protein EJ06DRAFT_525989 [Trichodelitschia bisporula]
MYHPSDPRITRRVNQLAQNLELANNQAQEHIYNFSHNYVSPYLSSISSCFQSCIAPCCPSEEERRRRHRGDRAELSFDFYDNDELDRLLNPSGPGRERAMSYGARRETPNVRRKSAVVAADRPDPSIITTSSYFGFLERMPWKIGRKGVRYKPSAADLQDHPGARGRVLPEGQALLEESDEDVPQNGPKRHKRNRSATSASNHTNDSYSSRGDLFPSEDEDDAIPIDDEFAVALGRTSSMGPDESGSARTRSLKSGSASRLAARSPSTKSVRDMARNPPPSDPGYPVKEVPTLSEFQAEEERVRKEEEEDVQRKRVAAQKLASLRGLGASTTEAGCGTPTSSLDDRRSKPPSLIDTIPFPAFDLGISADGVQQLSDDVSVDPTEHSPFVNTLNGSTSLTDNPGNESFVPAALPHFLREDG